MYTMGIDIGSTASKGIILGEKKEIVAKSIVAAGTGTSGPKKVLEELFKQSSLCQQDIKKTIATGYGRVNYPNADRQVTELSCHAKAVHHLMPSVRTIVDVGGQDTKVLQIDSQGRLLNFVMNDKCAAGTGRFLDVMARVLEVEVSELAGLSDKSTETVSISNTCTVFAESEVISHLSSGVKIPDIVRGIHKSTARRICGLVKRMGKKPDIMMTGGVARNSGIIKALEEELDMPIKVHYLAQLTGALGAALLAWEEHLNDSSCEMKNVSIL